MVSRARVSTVFLAAALLVAACNGGRKGAMGNDAATDVGPGGSDAVCRLRGDTGGSDAPVDVAQDVSTATDVGWEVGLEIPARVRDDSLDDRDADVSPSDSTADNECEVFVNGTSVGMTLNWGVAGDDRRLAIRPSRTQERGRRARDEHVQPGRQRPRHHRRADRRRGRRRRGAGRDEQRLAHVGDGARRRRRRCRLDRARLRRQRRGTQRRRSRANGDPPWGACWAAATRSGFWSAPVPADTASKPNVETTYARRTFYFSLDGSIGVDPRLSLGARASGARARPRGRAGTRPGAGSRRGSRACRTAAGPERLK